MASYNEVWSEMTRKPTARSEFFQIAGITFELEEFITEFVRSPEILDSLSLEKQREIEDQMDAVLALFC
jgi:hypothetical protein